MKISTNWLREYASTDLSPTEIGDLLTLAGLEVESVQSYGGPPPGVVVGRVVDVSAHPDADRLTVCKVDIGENDLLSIVCGAPNVAPGQRVAVATPGTTLEVRDPKGGTTSVRIKKTKIRGEVSNGMICAEDELGLGDDHEGILVLDDDAELGRPVAAHLAASGHPVGDTILDVAITPNRPDAASHVGVARDLAALTQTPLVRPDVSVPDAGGETAEAIEIRIESPDACPRYVARVIEGVTIGPSPAWMQARLRAVGLRPRNNVVDVTNFVMLELGQPLHAFDLDTISERNIIVRKLDKALRFVTLDDKERELRPETLMICDGGGEVAIAGVMGGQNSEVTPGTTNVLIESAMFDAASVRRSARYLGLQTDASYRFERGVDRDGQAFAASRAAQLIAELGGGRLLNGMVDNAPGDRTPRTVTLRMTEVERILGVAIEQERAEDLLRRIGLGVNADKAGVLHCTVPTFRPDIEREVDLIEEVGRLYGFDAIPMPETSSIPNFTPKERPRDVALKQIQTTLIGQGFREVYTNSLVDESLARRLNDPLVSTVQGDVVVTANPLTSEMTTLRPTLLAGVLPVVRYNANRGRQRLRLFEVGNVFAQGGARDGLIRGYSEHTSLLMLACGPRGPRAFDSSSANTDYYDLKGTVEALAGRLRVQIDTMPVESSTSDVAYGESLNIGDVRVGVLAKLADELATSFDAPADVFFAELDLDALVGAMPARERSFVSVSRFPIVERDLAIVVEEHVRAGDLVKTVRRTGGPLLLTAEIFDVYAGAGIAGGSKSVAMAMTFGTDRTLTDQEVDDAVAGIVSALSVEHGGELRT